MLTRLLTFIACLSLLAASLAQADLLELKDNDRVVLIGSTMIEREQRYGYWEAMFTSHYPRRSITFRNLGWSGDTVWGEARSGFGPPAEGYKNLIAQVTELKPTVIVVNYGLNESFAGEAGLTNFVDGFKRLMNDLSATKARIMVLAPIRLEALGGPHVDPTVANQNLWHYVGEMHELAVARDYVSVDLRSAIDSQQAGEHPLRLTDNGIHLSPLGYWVTAGLLENALQYEPSGWRVELDEQGKVTRRQGTTLADFQATPSGMKFQLTSNVLPVTALLRDPGHCGSVKVTGLASGKYELLVDDRRVALATHEQWAGLVAVDVPAELRQIEQLRNTIIKKNELYFHRWRPQNITYLFGFRKHEQGNNAVEIPQFDPLVVEQEREIAKLRVPQPHRFELKRVD